MEQRPPSTPAATSSDLELQVARTSKLAVGSAVLLVTSVSLVFGTHGGWQVLGAGSAVFSILLAYVALVRIRQWRGRLRGRRFAVPVLAAGGLGAVGLAFLIYALTHMSFSHGRPWRVRGRSVVPRWRRVRAGARVPARQAVLGAVWLKDAHAEHASVFAFESLAGQLQQLGAPAPLVARARYAAEQERGHARWCSARSAQLGLGVWRPRPVTTSPPPSATWGTVVEEALLDGALGERAVAVALRATAARVPNPSLRRALIRTAREEHAHARLAMDVVACAQRMAPQEANAALHRTAVLLRNARPAWLPLERCVSALWGEAALQEAGRPSPRLMDRAFTRCRDRLGARLSRGAA